MFTQVSGLVSGAIYRIISLMSKLTDYINNSLDIGAEYARIFGKELPTGKFFCPFHDNVNTPSAKRYGNVIKCFGYCQRSYSVYDLLKRFDAERIDEIARSVVLPEQSQRSLLRFQPPSVDRTKPIKIILDEIINDGKTQIRKNV